MAQLTADRNLLFGILAVQMDFVPRDALIQAMNAWVLAKERPLGDILQEQGALSRERRALLDALVAEHLRQHGGDPARSLAALRAAPAPHAALQQLQDPQGACSSTAGAEQFATRAPTSAEASGAVLRFRVLRPHAKGGLGEVFIAEDQELHREVALKEIRTQHADNPESRARFLLEAEITAGLEHPGVVPVYGLGQYSDGRPFYAMRFIHGDDLKQAIDRFHGSRGRGHDPGEHSVAFRKLLARFVAVCDIMAYAHSRGVLHRDLKPENIMLGKYGETIVVDWGLAKPLGDLQQSRDETETPLRPVAGSGSAETLAGAAIGTPAYMSPEQALGQVKTLNAASDIYSLGATLYCLITGRPPFIDPDLATVIRQVQRGAYPRPRELQHRVPSALEAICLKAMALKPSDRYPTARALADDIEHWLADEPVSAYREHWLKRSRRWARRHEILVTALVVLGLVGLAAGVLLERVQARMHRAELDRVQTQIDALLHADAASVPRALENLRPMSRTAAPVLRSKFNDAGLANRIRVRAGLGLLPDDPSVVGFLGDRLLEDTDPNEVLMLREQLAPSRAELTPKFWNAAEDAQTDKPRCLRALVALAAYDADSPRWAGVADRGAQALIDDPHLPIWISALRPVRAALLGSLERIFRTSKAGDDRLAAATVLADYEGDHPGKLTDLLLDADPRQYAVLWPQVQQQHQSSFAPLMLAELNKPLPADLYDPAGEDLARRQAQAAVTLLRLNQPERAWPLLRLTPDPRVRSYLIHLMAPLGVPRRTVVAHWGLDPDPSIRRALLLVFGTYDASESEDTEHIIARLLEFYQKDEDPGLHSAIDWLLRHRWQVGARIQKVDETLARQAIGGRRWYVTGQGQTLVVFPTPVEFHMGSPPQEPGRESDETLHRVRIPRPFAVATKPVTVAQFQRFLAAHPRLQAALDLPAHADPNEPVTGISWFVAARYCRWLSEQEGIAEDQMCFPPDGDIKEGMKLPANYLQRTGYRLPTEAEAEYAMRAGAVTSRYYGNSVALLPQYAWYQNDAPTGGKAVGLLMPNDFGLFDTLGNAREWSMDLYADYPTAPLTEDREGPLEVLKPEMRVLRGGSYLDFQTSIRCATRKRQHPTQRQPSDGFRLARTILGK